MFVHDNWGGSYPAGYESASLADFASAQDGSGQELFGHLAERAVNQWDGGFGSIVLHGAPETGKTHAALAFGQAMLLDRPNNLTPVTVHYRHLPSITPQENFTNSDRTVSDRPAGTAYAPFSRAATSRLKLVIADELNPDSLGTYHRLIVAAANAGALVVVTTNMHPTELLAGSANVKVPVPELKPFDILAAQQDGDYTQDLMDQHAKQQVELSASVRSRLAAARCIEFTPSSATKPRNWFDTLDE